MQNGTERMPKEEESASDLGCPSFLWVYVSPSPVRPFSCREGFAFPPRDNPLYGPSLSRLLCCYSPFLGYRGSFKLFLAIRWQCRSTNRLSSLSPWKTLWLLVERLVEPQIYVCLPLNTEASRICFSCKRMELPPWDASSLESSVARAFTPSFHLGPSFVHRGLFFQHLIHLSLVLPFPQPFCCLASFPAYCQTWQASESWAAAGQTLADTDFFLGS